MSSLTNVNNNASVVVVGRTAPVPPGQQLASKSLPVVLASDQPTIPVEEQNKIASEVALSLLGIPRSEVALGIFADVNTYDVNPTEWSSNPPIKETYSQDDLDDYSLFDVGTSQGHGLTHVPTESGALLEAAANTSAVLTSKRFFRYQPGRVSAATFGVKTSIIPAPYGAGSDPVNNTSTLGRNPAIRKYGIFDNYDGYYWETRDTGKGDQFVVVRRTQSILRTPILPFGTGNGEQQEDYNNTGIPGVSAGDLVIMRDGLVMVHAAMYDPSLLLDETAHPIVGISGDTMTIRRTDGGAYPGDGDTLADLEVGQHVSFESDTDIGGLTKTKVYKVYGYANVDASTYTVQLKDIDEDITSASVIDITGTLGSAVAYLKTPVPFIFPTLTGQAGDIMFPYARNFGYDRALFESPQGYIDTGADTFSAIAGDIDTVCDTVEWTNWIRWNVKPAYYKVYEYRIPRSRFSGDFLDGVDGDDSQGVYYSDVVRTGAGASTIKKPGQAVLDTATQQQVVNDSIWNLDFEKVVMQKIEFSWYGAVGALFLAYVPVGNGEARWARIHHLRASNQLKVASLGNATLPITYNVYGGGTENKYGYPSPSASLKRIPNYNGSYSQHITKYGASYYIDGGDRGTVRLQSYSSPVATNVVGSKLKVTSDFTYAHANWASADAANTIAPYIVITPGSYNPAASDFYIGAKVVTGESADQNVYVTFVGSGNKLYLNKPLTGSATTGQNPDIVLDRPQIVYGLQTKEVIVSSGGNAVRNRVQVYPTRMATGASSAGNDVISLQLRKNPLFQTFASHSGTTTLDSGETIILQPQGQPTALTLSSAPTMTAGTEVYGWFMGQDTNYPASIKFPVLGLLRKSTSGSYSFTAKVAFGVEVELSGDFLYAQNWDDGLGEQVVIATEAEARSTSEIAQLSSVVVATEARTPIPGTGTQVTTFYVPPGGEQFDLLQYFDYNKDYLSYPLTDEVDSLWLIGSSVDYRYSNGAPSDIEVIRSSILASLTWEEQ